MIDGLQPVATARCRHSQSAPDGAQVKVKPGATSRQEQSRLFLCLLPTRAVKSRRQGQDLYLVVVCPYLRPPTPLAILIEILNKSILPINGPLNGCKQSGSKAAASRPSMVQPPGARRIPEPYSRSTWLAAKMAGSRQTTTGSRAGPPPSDQSAAARALTSTLDKPITNTP